MQCDVSKSRLRKDNLKILVFYKSNGVKHINDYEEYVVNNIKSME